MKKKSFAEKLNAIRIYIASLIMVITCTVPWIRRILALIVRRKHDEPEDRVYYYNFRPQSGFSFEDDFVQDIEAERRNRLAKKLEDRQNFTYFINRALPRTTSVKTVKPLASVAFVPRRTLRQKIC